MRRGPGRPRDEDLDEQIIAATLGLIDAEEQVTVTEIVARSGVSRAALYRRWPSLTTLIAAALDVGRVVPAELTVGSDLRGAVFEALMGADAVAVAVGYPEARFRQRVRLVMGDRSLQKAYWTSHVVRRRAPLERALREGIDRGVLRPDLDVEACFDAIAGVAYYQLVVRGDPLQGAATRARMRAAFDVIWAGMVAAG